MLCVGRVFWTGDAIAINHTDIIVVGSCFVTSLGEGAAAQNCCTILFTLVSLVNLLWFRLISSYILHRLGFSLGTRLICKLIFHFLWQMYGSPSRSDRFPALSLWQFVGISNQVKEHFGLQSLMPLRNKTLTERFQTWSAMVTFDLVANAYLISL